MTMMSAKSIMLHMCFAPSDSPTSMSQPSYDAARPRRQSYESLKVIKHIHQQPVSVPASVAAARYRLTKRTASALGDLFLATRRAVIAFSQSSSTLSLSKGYAPRTHHFFSKDVLDGHEVHLLLPCCVANVKLCLHYLPDGREAETIA